MSAKKAILKKKIQGEIYELFLKTSADQVLFEDSTVAQKLAGALADIAALTGSTTGSISEQIQEAVKNKANVADVVSAVVASATNGAITITKGEVNSEVKLKGVVTVPTYDEETRTLTLPYTNSDGTTSSVIMALGKDMVVKSGAYDPTSKNINLTLTDNSVVSIPASALVDVYTGKATNSVQVTVNSNNEISAELKVSSVAGNAVEVKSDGVYVSVPEVDLSGYVQKDGSKVLSDNNYTNAEKTKLAGLSNYDDTELKSLINGKSKVILSASQPSNLAENDIWLQEVT